MRAVDIIQKKRDGHALSKEEIENFISSYTKGTIPDYQAAALLMAIYFQGMYESEVSELTKAMVHSGETVDLSMIQGVKVDKHSTGGVGDKLTLTVLPIVASLGIPVPKMSGRGLGHTGGTIDKLEAIPGYQTELATEQFIDLVNKNYMAVIGQSGNLTPADKKLYALRDVTATVHSIPLIASSVMSKKIAAGADRIVLDVKCGAGAFMENREEAMTLAKTMVNIGHALGRKTVALITNMDEPLGYYIGNGLEIKEAVDVLTGKGPEDLYELTKTLATYMVMLGKEMSQKEAETLVTDALLSGQARKKLKENVKSQGGDVRYIENTELFLQAKEQTTITAPTDGYIRHIDPKMIGQGAMMVGAGREKLGDTIDHEAGVQLHKKRGDWVEKGDKIATIYHQKQLKKDVLTLVSQAFHWSNHPVSKKPYIYQVITAPTE